MKEGSGATLDSFICVLICMEWTILKTFVKAKDSRLPWIAERVMKAIASIWVTAGHFSYIEDPDGTLIEFVETHKVPILKKLGWYLDLRKRNPHKSLPDWIVKTLRFSRVKN